MRQNDRNHCIVIVGEFSTDMIIKLKRIPRVGNSAWRGVPHYLACFKGANQAVSAARAGGKVAFVARLGQDDFGDQAKAAFAKEGINVEHIYRDRKVSTGVALIFVDQHGENSIGVAPGANGRLSPADLKKARRIFAGASVMVVQLEIPLETVHTAAVLAAKSGARVILNPAPARALPDELLRHVSILTPNETEAELLTGIKVDSDSAATKAASVLRARGVQTCPQGAGHLVATSVANAQLGCRVQGPKSGGSCRAPVMSSTAPWPSRWPKSNH